MTWVTLAAPKPGYIRAMTCLRAALLSAICVGLGCGDGGGFPADAGGEAPPPGGTLSLTWSLTDTNGNPILCDQVGGVTVTALLHNRAFQGGTTEVFSCNTGAGTTPPQPPGIYDIQFELTGVTGLITTAPSQLGIEVKSLQNSVVAPLAFAVNAVGGLSLTIDAQKAGGNCASVASGGAGITAMTITLQHLNGGACEPATLMIGTTPYTIDCTTPVETPCFEATTTVTAANLPSDSYQIHVRGKQNAAICYINDDSIRVPPNGTTLQRALNLSATGAATCI